MPEANNPLWARELREALDRGYPTNQQRRRWTIDQWAEFDLKLADQRSIAEAAYEAGNSNARLRELVDDLLERVDVLEQQARARNG